MFQFEDLRNELANYLSQDKIDLITEAYQVAAKAHEGQKRRTGEPYITHPIAVSHILATLRMDHESIMAAMLHDVLEDTPLTKSMIASQFGDSVAELVDGVSKLTQIKFENRAEQQAENFRKMLLAMVRDIRVILVKLADRLHNMRTLGVMPLEKRRRIARETLEIYAPIANRLGINAFRVEFEDLGFSTLHPMRARILKAAVNKARGNRKEIMQMIETALRAGLQKNNVDPKALHGREKHLYSIYKKIKNKNVVFSQIMDFYAFRILVDTVDQCYYILGLVHRLYKPVLGRFKDYIAIPKANGYQSLHTTLFGPYGVPIEVQIRTHEMHQMAEQGIAAHWLYKSLETSISQAQASTHNWLKGLMEMQQHAGNSLEFMQNVKIDLFPDEVYVFTPDGDIMELPAGATAVDFAYYVHTAIGNSCVAARIDRQLAPLSSQLINGQTVEIITSQGARPNPAWLSFVVTGKARSNIRHFLKSQKHSEAVALGKRMLEAALSMYHTSIDKIDEKRFSNVIEAYHLPSKEALFADIGIGNRTGVLVAHKLSKDQEKVLEIDGEISTQVDIPLAIKGTEGMVVNFAKCCWPIPGDPIVGFLSYGQGLTIHTESCKNMAPFREQLEKCVPLRWGENISGDFQVELRVEVINQRGMLANLAAAISDADANIDAIRSEDKDGRYSVVSMILSVRSRIHLARIMRRIRRFKAVTRIVRPR